MFSVVFRDDFMANKNNAKLTQEVQDTICKALEKGHSVAAACGKAGITERTYYNWYNRGLKAKSGKYHKFVNAVEKAKSKALESVEAVILDAIPTNTGDAKWWLTKHRPDIYGDRTFNETKVEADVKTDVTLNLLERVKEKRKELNDLGSN